MRDNPTTFIEMHTRLWIGCHGRSKGIEEAWPEVPDDLEPGTELSMDRGP